MLVLGLVCGGTAIRSRRGRLCVGGGVRGRGSIVAGVLTCRCMCGVPTLIEEVRPTVATVTGAAAKIHVEEATGLGITSALRVGTSIDRCG